MGCRYCYARYTHEFLGHNDPATFERRAEGFPTALVFKTFSDPFSGRVSLFRVFSGTIKSDTSYWNTSKDHEERIGKLQLLQGKQQVAVAELKAGDIIGVPLGPREVLAVVWAENANPDPRLHNRLKEVSEKLDIPPLKPELRAVVDWIANYTLSPRGMVLRMCLRMGENLGPERVRGYAGLAFFPLGYDAGAIVEPLLRWWRAAPT